MFKPDFKQPSTWKGIAGFIALFGIAVSPELTNAICMALGFTLSAIEVGRNEYATRQAVMRELEAHKNLASFAEIATAGMPPAGVVATDVERVEQLRQPLQPANDATDDLPPPPGFSNR